jgi:UDP-glucose 4-epimerase
MRILVTGACGFVGSNIVERLVSDGHEVTALDNLHTGNAQNLAIVKDRITTINASASDIARFPKHIGVLFHQGVFSSSPMYKENPHLVSKAIDDMISLLEYCRKNNTRLIFASSSSLYNGHAPPHNEGMTIKITDFYTEARYMMERLATLYHDLYGVRSIALRYFSVYGPHEEYKKQYANLITQFIWDVRNGKEPVVYGDGSQTRDFIHVNDVVEANITAMKANAQHDVFNVGSGTSISINDMIKLLSQKLGKEIRPRYVNNKIKNYVQHTCADTSKAEKILGFKANISLENGIERQLMQYRSAPMV